MGISVVVRTERGEDLMTLAEAAKSIPPPSAPAGYTDLLGAVDRSAYPLLRDIDPHGNTVFNGMQAKSLVQELARLQPLLDGADLSLARALVVLVAQQVARPHRYLWFIGD